MATLLQTDGWYIGPGHFGLLREKNANYVSIHYYDGYANGNPKLDILKMTMYEGWPQLTHDFSFSTPTGIIEEIYTLSTPRITDKSISKPGGERGNVY